MILTALAYALVYVSALFWGKRLYGSWSAAIVLAFVSPIPFALLAPLIIMVLVFLFRPVLSLFPSTSLAFDNEWVQGTGMFIAAIMCSLILRYFAKTEGVKSESDKSTSTPLPPP